MIHYQRGKFITIEGVECAGKTTQIPHIAQAFRDRGHEVLTVREPGGTPTGDQIRELLLHGSKMQPVTELLLFLASRQELAQTVILPHLERGGLVLADRYLDSTWAYQGFGRGLEGHLEALEPYLDGGVYPDITLFFNLPFEESQRRLALRSEKQDRLDLESEVFHREVYRGYQHRLSQGDVCRTVVEINALPEVEQVTQRLQDWVNHICDRWA